MGLDCSHGCWNGAYSAFHRWRTAVAKAAGIPLGLMDGHNESWINSHEFDEIDKALPYPRSEAIRSGLSILRSMIDVNGIPWKILGNDPLVYLLNHSDCDGQIEIHHLDPLANRLEELLPVLETYGDGGGHIGKYADKTRTFINGLRLAASRGEPVLFH